MGTLIVFLLLFIAIILFKLLKIITQINDEIKELKVATQKLSEDDKSSISRY